MCSKIKVKQWRADCRQSKKLLNGQGHWKQYIMEFTEELVKIMGSTAELMRVLGSTPIAGPIVSLLGLSLEIVCRDRADAENLKPTKSELHYITSHTVKVIQIAVRNGFEEYKERLLDLLPSIEQIANRLETYGLDSTMQNF